MVRTTLSLTTVDETHLEPPSVHEPSGKQRTLSRGSNESETKQNGSTKKEACLSLGKSNLKGKNRRKISRDKFSDQKTSFTEY